MFVFSYFRKIAGRYIGLNKFSCRDCRQMNVVNIFYYKGYKIKVYMVTSCPDKNHKLQLKN